MTRIPMRTLLLATVTALSLTACATEPSPSVAAGGVIVVHSAPPPARVEVIGHPPYPDAVWIQGHWMWRDRWVWNGGHWAHRPHPNAKWAPGRWHERRHGEWTYRPGRWR
ncbi:MAG: hypothetical protein P8Y64_09520 [Gammaproteobacteria bacterium]|jgi:hypothetical protein